jgi:hypothetical protein
VREEERRVGMGIANSTKPMNEKLLSSINLSRVVTFQIQL